MPFSAAEGRGWFADRIGATTTPVIVDVGAGEGTHSILARHLRLDAKWIALEIYEPYVERFGLAGKYDEVYVSDVTKYDWSRWPTEPFTVLLGDVVEHLPYDRAVRLLQALMRNATEILVSVPIIDSPQGEVFGNCHEAHLYQWKFEEMKSLLPGCDSWKGEIVGRYHWRRG